MLLNQVSDAAEPGEREGSHGGGLRATSMLLNQ